MLQRQGPGVSCLSACVSGRAAPAPRALSASRGRRAPASDRLCSSPEGAAFTPGRAGTPLLGAKARGPAPRCAPPPAGGGPVPGVEGHAWIVLAGIPVDEDRAIGDAFGLLEECSGTGVRGQGPGVGKDAGTDP